MPVDHKPPMVEIRRGRVVHDVPLDVPIDPKRWPYGPPAYHQSCCLLFRGADYCDCAASAADDTDYGRQA